MVTRSRLKPSWRTVAVRLIRIVALETLRALDPTIYALLTFRAVDASDRLSAVAAAETH